MVEKDFNLSEHEQVEGYFPKDKIKELIKEFEKRVRNSKRMGYADSDEVAINILKELAGDGLVK